MCLPGSATQLSPQNLVDADSEAFEIDTPAGTRKLIRFQDCELAFRWCQPGTFSMGSPENEKGRYDDENQVSVNLTKGFWMMETVVTQKLWQTVTGERLNWTKIYGLGDNHPAYNVAWKMAVDFCKNFTDKLQSSGLIPSELQLTLPTEAQWEYACRAGTQTAYCFGDNSRMLGDYAWFICNSKDQTHPVGQKKPNAWGLYDMHGNVWEWTADAYEEKLRAGVDPYFEGEFGSDRVNRGGGWGLVAAGCRSAIRNWLNPSFRNGNSGFRLVISPSRHLDQEKQDA